MSYFGSALLVGSDKTPFVTAYQFVGGVVANGFASTYSAPPDTPAGTVNGIAFSPDGKWVAFAVNVSPFIEVRPWNNATGFGAKVANPLTLPAGAAQTVAWSPDGAYVGVANTGTPFQAIYPFSNGTLGTRVTNPGILPAGNAIGISWSPDGAYVGFAHFTTPFVSVYPWSGGAYGTKVSNPAALPGGNGIGISWSPDGTVLAISTATVNKITGYPWSAGFGTQFLSSAPGAGTVRKAVFSPDGAYIGGVQQSTGNKKDIWPYSGGAFGTLSETAATTSNNTLLSWKPTNDFVAVSQAASPYILVYPWSAGSLGSPLANPSVLPPVTSTAAGVAWALDTVAPPLTTVANSLQGGVGAYGGFTQPEQFVGKLPSPKVRNQWGPNRGSALDGEGLLAQLREAKERGAEERELVELLTLLEMAGVL